MIAHNFSLPPGDMWVFGYGSLMWRPGFDFVERQSALLRGRHRRLCVWSWYHRGLEHAPGLVMGLDSGGSVRGAAFRVAESASPDVFDYLAAREMVTPVYVPTHIRLALENGRTVSGVTFTVDRRNPQYAGRISVDTAVNTVRNAQGHSGRNIDYVRETTTHLREIGVHDPFMEAVVSGLGG